MAAHSTTAVYQELCEKTRLSTHTQPEIFLVLGLAYKQMTNPKWKLWFQFAKVHSANTSFFSPMLCIVYVITNNVLIKDFGGLLQDTSCEIEAFELLNFREA